MRVTGPSTVSNDLVPVGDELRLVALAARHPRAAVAGVGGQQPAQHRRRPAAAARRGSPPRPPPARRRRSPAPWPPRRPAGLSRRPSPARARPGAPLFPSRPGRGILLPARPAPPGGPRRSPRSPPRSARPGPGTARTRDLPARLVQLRPRSQVHGPRPPVRLPRQVPLRPVTGMTRGRARAVRLPALPADLVQRPPPEVPDLPQLRVKVPAAALQLRQLIRHRPARHPQSESINTLRLSPQPATIQNPYESDAHPHPLLPPAACAAVNCDGARIGQDAPGLLHSPWALAGEGPALHAPASEMRSMRLPWRMHGRYDDGRTGLCHMYDASTTSASRSQISTP